MDQRGLLQEMVRLLGLSASGQLQVHHEGLVAARKDPLGHALRHLDPPWLQHSGLQLQAAQPKQDLLYSIYC